MTRVLALAARLAATIGPLSQGIAGLIQQMGPGLSAAFSESVPLLEELARDLPEIGKGISYMLEQFAAGGQGAQEGLRTLTMIIIGLLMEVGLIVRGLSDFYSWLIKIGDGTTASAELMTRQLSKMFAATGPLNDLVTTIHNIWLETGRTADGTIILGRSFTAAGADAQLTADDLTALSTQINQVAVTADTLAGQMSDKVFSALTAADKATLGLHESSLKLGEALAKNGRAIDSHTHLVSLDTAAGQANRQAVIARIEANIRQYDTDIAAGLGAQQAATAYDQNTAALERQLRKAGFTAGQIDDLIGKYRKVPDRVDTAIATQGLTDAINGLADLIRLINGIPKYTVVTVEENRRITGTDPYAYQGHASGGVAGGLVTVGEYGREVVRLPQGSMVYPHGQSEQMLAGAGSDSAAGQSGVSGTTVWLGPGIDSVFATYLQRLVATGQLVL